MAALEEPDERQEELVGAVVAGGVAPSPSRSNGTCPASSAIRSRAIATSTASCSSSCAEPRCSTIVRTPRVFDAICTAVAPDAVRTFHPSTRLKIMRSTVETLRIVPVMVSFGIGVAVLLDAFLVRLVLLPVMLRLTVAAAWWSPAWLTRVLPNIRFAHD